MRDRNRIFNAGRVFGRVRIHGLHARGRRADAPARGAQLSRVCSRVRGDLFIVASVRLVPLLGPVAVRCVFRLTPACERAANKEAVQPLGGVRAQSGMVRRDHVRDVEIRFCDHDGDRIYRYVHSADHSRGGNGVFPSLRLRNVPRAGDGEYAGEADRREKISKDKGKEIKRLHYFKTRKEAKR